MSAVELAVKKAGKLSDRQARELLGWLGKRQSKGTSLKRVARTTRPQSQGRHSMRELMAWPDSVRGTTDWQPPRMPDDLVKPVRLWPSCWTRTPSAKQGNSGPIRDFSTGGRTRRGAPFRHHHHPGRSMERLSQPQPEHPDYESIKRFVTDLPRKYRVLNFDARAATIWGGMTAPVNGLLLLCNSFIAAIVRSQGSRVIAHASRHFCGWTAKQLILGNNLRRPMKDLM